MSMISMIAGLATAGVITAGAFTLGAFSPTPTDSVLRTPPPKLAAPGEELALTAAEWAEAFAMAKDDVPGCAQLREGVEYRWTGTGPLRIYGWSIPREALELPSEQLAELPDIVFQPDPVLLAEFLGSEQWVADEEQPGSPSLPLPQEPIPADCQVVLTQTGLGTFSSFCAGPCGVQEACNGDTTPPTFCACTRYGLPPTSPPTYCHGEITFDDPPTSAQFDCTGSCPGQKTCRYYMYIYNELTRFYCKCQ